MSMWELEALAEHCVNMVHASELPLERKRELYVHTFDLVSGFDISFVHFRVTKALTEAQMFFRIDVTDHPQYEARRAELDEMVAAGDDEWLMSKDDVEALYESSDKYHPSGLWFDVRMALWRKAVKSGVLSGLAAKPVAPAETVETIVALMEVAAEDVDTYGQELRMLHGFLAWPHDAVLTAGDPRLTALRDSPALAAALRQEHDDWVEERFDARAYLEWAGDEDAAFLESYPA